MSDDIHTTPTRKVRVVEPLSRTFVVAGTYAQFRNWQDADYKNRMRARYVRGWDDLRGWPTNESTVVLFIGEYYRRTDIGAISDLVADMRYLTIFESALSAGAAR